MKFNLQKIVSILIGLFVVPIIGQVSQAEREALISLYNSTGGDNWINTKANDQPWLITDNSSLVSSWKGVRVQGDKVVAVELSSNNLVGTIDFPIDSLLDLETLDLSNNTLNGSIPSSLGSFSKLKSVDLSNNNFSGTIPKQLESITLLTFIDISGNRFLFQDIVPVIIHFIGLATFNYIPQQKIGSSITLNEVDHLDEIRFSDNLLFGVPLQYEWYQVNNDQPILIEGQTSKTLVVTNATTLANSGEYFFKAKSDSVPGLILERESITVNVAHCDLVASEKQELLNFYKQTRGDQWVNTLVGDKPWSIDNSPCDWYGVTIEDGHVVKLELSNNNLYGGFSDFRLNLFSELVVLNLSNNNLFWRNVNDEFTDLSSLINLKEIYLSNNAFRGDIPAAFGSLVNLEKLYFDNNRFNNDQIPSSFCNLTSLKEFSLANNQISGNIIPEFRLLTNLELLDLSNNFFTGVLPSSLNSLRKLKYLDISNNQLEGDLPSNLSNFNELSTLLFDNNSFVFSNFEEQHEAFTERISNYSYKPQSKTENYERITINEGEKLELVSGLKGDNNGYVWFKDGELLGGNSSTYTLENVQLTDAGDYFYEVRNVIVGDLVLTRKRINVTVEETCKVSPSEKTVLLELYKC